MKKILNIVAGGLLVFASCNDVLDTEEQNAIDGDRVFSDPSVAELALNTLYNYVLPGFAGPANVILTDESVGNSENLMYGLHPEPVNNSTNTLGNYSIDTYGHIRQMNLFIDGMERGSIEGEARNSLLGQAFFLRAWKYWSMVRDYGGVPAVYGILDVNDRQDNQVPRSTTAECVDLILNDLDMSINMLGDYESSDFGRITKAAAAAFKGRILLFYASPMYVSDGATNADGLPDRWENAYTANLEARQIAEGAGYGLHPDFSKKFLDESNPVEAIFLTRYSVGLKTHGYEVAVRPPSVNTSTPGNLPNWDLVSSFPMKDGFPIGESPSYTYNEDVYWYNRDPRFYATIAYNSCTWAFEGFSSDRRQWTYVGNTDEDGSFVPSTGFYLRKNVDTALPMEQINMGATDWIEISFTEVLLNLAECANETNRQSETYSILYEIRDRAGIEEGTGNYGIPSGLSKAELREVIMNERKIELAYENKRYWDLRRRNMYINGVDGTEGGGLNGTRRQKIITKLDETYVISVAPDFTGTVLTYFEDNIRDTVDWDNPANYDLYFDMVIEDAENTDINYLQPKYNFYYLPPRAIDYNDNLEQTAGWPNGTFSPWQE